MSDLPQLPEDFTDILQKVIPEERYQEVLESFSCQKPLTFRYNLLKTDSSSVINELNESGIDTIPVAWNPEAFEVPTSQRDLLTRSDAFNDGRIYIQNLSSMVAPIVLAPLPEETVLDLAAAPGGKTLQLAAMMQNTGRLSAVEAVKNRFFKLKANLERCGVTNAKTYLTDGRSVGYKCPEMFDRILLDAPCSSEARFNRNDPESWAHWSLRKVREASKKQKGLIQSALYSLKVGGTLVYCTCSLSPEENEAIIAYILKKFPDSITIEQAELPFDNWTPGLTQWGKKSYPEEVAKSVRILPTEKMDAFFLCKIRKTAGMK